MAKYQRSVLYKLRCGILHLICMYVYFISKSVNILYNTTQEYILYNIIQR